MSSAPNPYYSEPAAPVLAHSLLLPSPSIAGLEIHSRPTYKSAEPNSLDTWNLKRDIEDGLHSSPDSTFRSGTVIGFSRLRGKGLSENDDEFIGELPRYLLAKWLCQVSSSPNPSSKAFIIHPANFDVFSPKKLLASLLSLPRQPAISRNEAILYLDSVQLFPVFDFAAAVEAINEVSDTLHTLWKSPCEKSYQPESSCSMTLVIAGLDTLTEGVIRASNAVRGTAVLASALRTLTQLSRMHRSYLSVVLVNSSGVGPVVRQDSGAMYSQSQGSEESYPRREDGINSIFRTTESSLFPSLLMRTLEQGIDTHLLLSNTRTAPVVEVIKDRVGDGVGKWCAWGKNR